MSLYKKFYDTFKFLYDNRSLYLEYILSIIAGMFFLFTIYFVLFPTLTPLQQDPLKDFKLTVISFCAGIFAGITTGMFTGKMIVTYNYEKNKNLKFIESHDKLKQEIYDNIIKLRKFRAELDKAEITWITPNNKTPYWLPKKVNPARVTMQYLSTKAYDYFISLDNPEMGSGSLERLFNFNFFVEISVNIPK